MLFCRSSAIDKLLLGGQSKTWILSNTLVTITTSGVSQLGEDDARPAYHGGPISCTHCGWAEVLIRRPTGNISWLMRLQNQVGGAVASANILNSTEDNETVDEATSKLTTPVISRTSSHSNNFESATQTDADLTTAVDVINDNIDLCDDQQFPIEVDGQSASPVILDDPLSQESETAGSLTHTSDQLRQQRSRHTSSCSLELLPPLMSYEESQTKSPSLHGGGGHLTDEEQV